MHIEFPKLADTLIDGTLSAWYKTIGDSVRKGEPLFAVETDKVNTDVEAPADGVLSAIFVAAGERADVGQALGELHTRADETSALAQPAPLEGGVHTAVSRPIAAHPSPASTLTPMRRRIAERMTQAHTTITQGSCARLVDLGGIDRVGRSWTAYFVRALGVALDAQRIGVAVEISGGLVVPVVPNAASGTLDAIAATVADLAVRARAGKLTAADVGGAAATVTNVGGSGTLLAFPLVAPNESAILAPGAIVAGRCWISLCYDRAQFNEYAADRLLSRVIDNVMIERHSERFT